MFSMLLVEDDRRTAFAYESLLAAEHPDIAVETVFCAEDALLHLSKRNYDLILSDFKLPGLDGLGLLVASYCLYSHVPFVLISAYGDREVEHRAARLGAYAVLHKPIAPDALIHVIERALTKGRCAIEQGRATDRVCDTSILPQAKKTMAEERIKFRNNR
ncbi:MAG TPA: response regulator [Nitrospiraceae bacterium]|nr:response regulator [Nitrospiraceae bacterium]